MRPVSFVVGLVVVVLAHLAGTWLAPDFPRWANLFVALVVLVGLGARSLPSMAAGSVAGLLHDVLSGGPYGLYGFADTIVGYATARLSQRLILTRVSAIFAVIAAAVLLEEAILILLVTGLTSAAPSPSWVDLGIRAAVSGLAGALAYAARIGWGNRRERRRYEGGSKLKL